MTATTERRRQFRRQSDGENERLLAALAARQRERQALERAVELLQILSQLGFRPEYQHLRAEWRGVQLSPVKLRTLLAEFLDRAGLDMCGEPGCEQIADHEGPHRPLSVADRSQDETPAAAD